MLFLTADLCAKFTSSDPTSIPQSISLHLAIEIQESLLYLSANCLLSAKDSRIVCQWLLSSVTAGSLADLRTTLPNAISLSPDLLRPAALGRMISEAVLSMPNGYARCILDGSMLYHQWRYLSMRIFVEQGWTNLWMIILIPQRPLSQASIGHQTQSIYVNDDPNSTLLPLVLLPRIVIHRMHTPVIMFFRSNPSSEQVRVAADTLGDALVTQHGLTIPPAFGIVTEPIPYDSHFSDSLSLYRLDGRINQTAVSKILKPLLLHAKQRGYTMANGWTAANPTPALLMPRPTVEQQDDGIARHLILYARVSSNEQVHFSTSLAQQILMCLQYAPVQYNQLDRITCLLECSSSWRYAWMDRPFARSFLRPPQINPAQQHLLLTASAERLTRRPDDVPTILDNLGVNNVTWMTMGYQNGDQRRWVTIDQDSSNGLTEILDFHKVS